jgi:hypothetical protein
MKMIIGIDPGVQTGLALYDTEVKILCQLETVPIHRAMETVLRYHSQYKIVVRFEDARLRKWFGKAGREKLQGADSVKRDCRIWEDFLKDSGIPFEAVAPQQNKTKIKAETFRKITGWTGRTTEHSRDAGMLVYGYKIKKQWN